MSFLTQALIDAEDAARLALRDTYDWHQLVWRAFPGRDGQPRDFLTRLDRPQREPTFRLLIVSPRHPVRPPDWPQGTDAWQTREIAPSFFAHRRYRFQLRANPTKRENVSRKRMPLLTPEEQRAWLQRKATTAGFTVDEESLRTVPEGRSWFRIEKQDRRGIHHAVEFEGVLSVADPALFQLAFARGIGSAKGFGFGLLALAPIA